MENVEEVKRKSKGKWSPYGKRYGYEFFLKNDLMGIELNWFAL
jgi:hypothetical protein